jgi:hypothetical protein
MAPGLNAPRGRPVRRRWFDSPDSGNLGAVEDMIDATGLAEMLADQFAALDDARPVESRVVQDGDMVIFAFTWPLSRADEVISTVGHGAQLTEFRSELLQMITPSLAELVELDLGRQVASSLATLAEDPRHVMVTFVLGAPKETDPEAVEALRNWARQLRRNAGVQRRRYRKRREELRRQREELIRRRTAGPSG